MKNYTDREDMKYLGNIYMLCCIMAGFFLTYPDQGLSAELTDVEQQELESIMAILTKNPQIIPALHQSLNGYVRHQVQFDQLLSKNHDYLFNNLNHIQFGAKKPELTIINFTDYNCPFCKRLDPVLQKLVKNHSNLKVVNVLVPLKEMNLADENKVTSASYAINVWKNNRNKFFHVNEMLIKKPSKHNMASLKKIGEKTGTLDDIKSDNLIHAMIKKNYNLFIQFGMSGTPAMLIDREVIPGFLPYEKLEKIIRNKIN